MGTREMDGCIRESIKNVSLIDYNVTNLMLYQYLLAPEWTAIISCPMTLDHYHHTSYLD